MWHLVKHITAKYLTKRSGAAQHAAVFMWPSSTQGMQHTRNPASRVSSS